MSLEGRAVFIAGANGDVAGELARELAQQRASIALAAGAEHDLGPLSVELRSVTPHALARQVDFTDAASIGAAVDEAAQQFGRLDALVNNLVIEDKIDFLETPASSWDRQMSYNARAPFLAAQAAARHMVEAGKGSIVNVGSIAGMVFWPRTAAYNATRAALIALTSTLALELAPRGIRVNGVAAGHVATEQEAERLRDPAIYAETISQMPIGRTGDPRELVGPIMFLLSDASSFVVGHTLVVDGGYTLR